MEQELLDNGLEFTRTTLGQSVFIKIGAKHAGDGLFPTDWTIQQLKTIVKYMESHPNCTLFSDGSGTTVKE